jgi:AAA domain
MNDDNAGMLPEDGKSVSAVGPVQERLIPNGEAEVCYPISLSAADLIRLAKERPPEPIIEGLISVGDTLLVHGSEENYKSVFVVQMAESIAIGKPLMYRWRIRGRRRVGILGAEMHPAMLGERLGKMFPEGNAPENIRFVSEEFLREWRRRDLKGKFDMIEKWIAEDRIQVLMIDPANDFFRGEENPSDERNVGAFFDMLRSISLDARILVRHDRKKKDFDDSAHSNELIRGSAEWKEDPEAILAMKRIDKRTHEVNIEIGKLRYGIKPEPFSAWFDAGCFRLTPLPPVIAVLATGAKLRQQIIDECEARFGLSERSADDLLREYRQLLTEGRDGHEKSFELNPERAKEEPWFAFLRTLKAGG